MRVYSTDLFFLDRAMSTKKRDTVFMPTVKMLPTKSEFESNIGALRSYDELLEK